MNAANDGKVWFTSKKEPTKLFLSETTCKCGCKRNTMQQRIVDLFHALRTKEGFPLHVNSGFRCAEYNKKVGGKPNSQHLSGRALDLMLPKDLTPDAWAKEMESVGVTAIGKYKTFCHMDDRIGSFRWDQRQIGG